MLELSDKIFKSIIITMPHKLIMNVLKINGKTRNYLKRNKSYKTDEFMF